MNQPHRQEKLQQVSSQTRRTSVGTSRRDGKDDEELTVARSLKSVERLMLFLAEDVSLFQGNLVIFLRFSKTEFKVNSLAKAARHMQLKLLLLKLGHSKSSLRLQTPLHLMIFSDNISDGPFLLSKPPCF